jgi:4'-phosphopantetheinyl transferase EntD
MSGIRTRYVPLAELALSAGSLLDWLSREEYAAYSAMRSPSRQRSWLAGRIVAKQLLLDMLAQQRHPLAGTHVGSIHIQSRCPTLRRGLRPLVLVNSRRLGVALSIAHTDRGVLAAASLSDQFTLGVDLVPTQASAQTLAWTFTDAERCWLAAAGAEPGRAEQLWAMKEAIYKACQRSEGFSPRTIEVVPGRAPRYPRSATASALVSLQCWRIDGQRAALAVAKNFPNTLAN